MSEQTPPMPFEKAHALLRETAKDLGGEYLRAFEVLARYAERGRRPSSMRLQAVGDAALGAQHFAKATADLRDISARVIAVEEDLNQGLDAVRRSSRAIREAEVETSDDDPRRET